MTPESRAPGIRSRNSQTNPAPRLPRSVLDRSYRHSTTGDAGFLLPLFVDEILPGDTVKLNASFFARLLAPLQEPVLDELILDAQAYFVPFRLLWENWERMMGARDNPDDHNDYVVPTINAPVDNNGWQRHSLSDYFGVRTETDGIDFNALYHRAYYLIWNDHYRDQNLQDKLVIPTGDGPDAAEQYTLQRRGKRKDYITGALPFQQKGDAVTIPIAGFAPVIGGSIDPSGAGVPTFDDGINAIAQLEKGNGSTAVGHPGASSGTQQLDWGDPGLVLTGAVADLTFATGITMNDFRDLVVLQRQLESDARTGTRYVEILHGNWDVTPEDSRLQRPEFLWSTQHSLMVHVVPATFGDAGGAELGQLGAYMQGRGDSRGFTKSFTEHGALMVLVSVRAPLRYQQNVPRMYSRETRFDYYWPEFALISEQAVLNKEVYATGGFSDELVFGYQPRYEEYRRRDSIVTGALRSDDPLSLDVYHLVQDFDSLPDLNSTFIQDEAPVPRVIQVAAGEPQLLFDCFWNVNHVRLMPVFAEPGLPRL